MINMMNTDPINERYEKQKEKIDRFHSLLEDIYNETHYFEKIEILIADTKAEAYERIDRFMNSLDDVTNADRDAGRTKIIEFSTSLLSELEADYVSINNIQLQEYVDKLFGNYIRCLSEEVLIAGNTAERVMDLIGIHNVKPFAVGSYKCPNAEVIDTKLQNEEWSYHFSNYLRNFGDLYFFYVKQIVSKITATFKYHAIKEFMQPYNATMYAMMYIQNQTIEKLICALQAMENA